LNKQRTTVDELVQTESERDPDYAAKYRLKMVPRLSATGPKRTSEYQRQFQWRSFERNSPLMAAQQMIYKSHPELSSVDASVRCQSNSEYSSQFRPWTVTDEKPTEPVAPSTHKLRRTKSLKELSHVERSTSNDDNIQDTASDVVEDGTRAAAPNQNKHTRLSSSKPVTAVPTPEISVAANFGNFFPSRRVSSEYASKFLPPSTLLRKAVQHQLQHQIPGGQRIDEASRPHSEATVAKSVPVAADWYAEVLELRQHANEYRRRAHGTHFSRDHLAQLCARNAELWDTVSNSSMLSALSGEATEQNREPAYGEQSSVSDCRQPDSAREVADVNDINDVVDEELESARQFAEVTKRKTSAPSSHGKPATGTASGMVGQSVVSHCQHRQHRNLSTDQQQQQPVDVSSGRGKLESTATKSVSRTLMTHGLPTHDSHVLVDTTNVLLTDRHNKKDIAVSCHSDDDELAAPSTARSIESSCSLASQVLARARSRRDEFWK
jgi:hypothetical protein